MTRPRPQLVLDRLAVGCHVGVRRVDRIGRILSLVGRILGHGVIAALLPGVGWDVVLEKTRVTTLSTHADIVGTKSNHEKMN